MEDLGEKIAIAPEAPPLSTIPPHRFKAKVKVILTPATSMTAIFRLSGIIVSLECANECLDHYTYKPTLSDWKLMCKDRASFEVEGKKVDYIKSGTKPPVHT